MKARRKFFKMPGLGAGLFSATRVASARPPDSRVSAPPEPPVAVQSPDLKDLPFTLDNGVKVFHLIAEPVKRKIVPNKTIDVWGYNGSAPGPTIQITQGDRVRIVVDNHLPEPTSMHWHGFEIPHSMDGGPGISQIRFCPGAALFTNLRCIRRGPSLSLAHGDAGNDGDDRRVPHASQIAMLRESTRISCSCCRSMPDSSEQHRTEQPEHGIQLADHQRQGRAGDHAADRAAWRSRPHTAGQPWHGSSSDAHSRSHVLCHRHRRRAHSAAAWQPGNTVLVGVAQARDIEFVANNPGDWMIHCHMPHHMMNQMASVAGPMTRLGSGMPAGGDMNIGMGMLTGSPGVPAGEDYGPALGRGLGVGSTSDHTVANNPMAGDQDDGHSLHDMPQMSGTQREHRTDTWTWAPT